MGCGTSKADGAGPAAPAPAAPDAAYVHPADGHEATQRPLARRGGAEVASLFDATHACWVGRPNNLSVTPGARDRNAVPGVYDESHGGHWILLQCYSHLGGTNPPLQGNALPNSQFGLSHTTVQHLSEVVGAELSSDDIEAVRFYAHTSAHPRIVHFVSTHPRVKCAAYDGDTVGIDPSWFTDEATTKVLPGHTATLPKAAARDDRFEKTFAHSAGRVSRRFFLDYPFYDASRTHGWCVGGSSGKRWCVDDDGGTAHTTLHQVWVRLKQGKVSVDGDSGPYVRDDTIIPHLEGGVGSGSLRVKQQPSLDSITITMMALPEDVPREMQQRLLRERPREVLCFHCDGTGLRSVAVKNVYGTGAVSSRTLGRRSVSDRGGVGRLGRGIAAAHIDVTLVEGVALGAGADESKVDGADAGGGGGADAGDSTDPRALRKTLSHGDAAGADRDADSVGDSASAAADRVADEADASGALSTSVAGSSRTLLEPKKSTFELCWVCRGTGAASEMLGTFDYEEGKSAAGAASTAAGEASDDDEDCCEICWTDPPKYGISSECTHFYCADCIKDHLETILKNGTTPAFCPGCQDDAPSGRTPESGRIEAKALSFLASKGVVSKEFMFRFMRLQNKTEELWFQCPNKACGRLLVDVDPELVLRDGQFYAQVEKCPCGEMVCVGCHAQIPEAEVEAHQCPDAARAARMANDEVARKFMATIGKKCPKCSMFVQKDGGCDYMMCGTTTHGKLYDAIRNGGCGHGFSWSSGKPVSTFFQNLQGQRVTGDPAAMYPAEIAALRKKLGIVPARGAAGAAGAGGAVEHK